MGPKFENHVQEDFLHPSETAVRESYDIKSISKKIISNLELTRFSNQIFYHTIHYEVTPEIFSHDGYKYLEIKNMAKVKYTQKNTEPSGGGSLVRSSRSN